MEFIVRFPGLGLEFTVNRVAFSIGGYDIYWYGVLIGLGLCLGIANALFHTQDFGIDTDKLLDGLLIGSASAVVGARLYYILFNPDFHPDSFFDYIDLRDGGMGFYGSLIGALVAAWIYCKLKKIYYIAGFDLVAMGFLIGQGIGRWGNFFNQEAFGTNTTLPWGMISDQTTQYLQMANIPGVDPYLPVHPTFLYESLWCILGFVLLTIYCKYRRFDGEILLMYIAWNGVARVLIEGLRTDSLMLGSFRVSQLVAGLGAAVSIAAIVVIRLRIAKVAKETGNPNYKIPYAYTDGWKKEYADIVERREAEKNKRRKKNGTGTAKQPENVENIGQQTTAEVSTATVPEQPVPPSPAPVPEPPAAPAAPEPEKPPVIPSETPTGKIRYRNPDSTPAQGQTSGKKIYRSDAGLDPSEK